MTIQYVGVKNLSEVRNTKKSFFPIKRNKRSTEKVEEVKIIEVNTMVNKRNFYDVHRYFTNGVVFDFNMAM